MEKNSEFIMLPTVDFCFKKLMENPKVRQGFVAALLKVDPRFIQKTRLIPTAMNGEFPNDKLGILDVRILLMDETQMNLEMQVRYFEYWDERAMFYLSKMFAGQMKKGDEYNVLKKCIHVSILDFIHFPKDDICYRSFHLRDDQSGNLYSDKLELQVLELKKLSWEVQTGDDIIAWMKFFSGKNRKEFESMAKTNEYMDEAYDTLLKLSADDKERLEYEAREKAIRDYNSQMSSARRQGLKEGEEIGIQKGLKEGAAIGAQNKTVSIIKNLLKKGLSDAEICEIAECSQELIEEVRKKR